MWTNLRLFTIVVWLGVLANWSFAVWAIFFDTNALLRFFGLGSVESTVWVYNYSILLAILSCFYIPAAHNPFRYRANAWLLIVGRLIPASTFFIGVWLGFMPPGFARLGIGDADVRHHRADPVSAAVARRRERSARAGLMPRMRTRGWLGLAALRGRAARPSAHGTSCCARCKTEYSSIVEYFKYGSVGVEAASGLPYDVWAVLPEVFADRIGPDGYASFGFLYEKDHATPIGLSTELVGFTRVGINCGLCHIGSVRETAASPRQLLIGAPNSTLDLQRYFRFLFAAAADPRFTPDVLIPAIERRQPVSLVDRLLLRFAIIPQLRSGLLDQQRQLWWMDTVPDWGTGRVDPFNPAKVQLVHLPWDGSIGASRMVPLWNWRERHNFGLHRDGLNTSLTEIFLNSGIGNGANNSTIDLAGLTRLQDWVGALQPPPYPFPIDRELAAQGEPIFQSQCADVPRLRR